MSSLNSGGDAAAVPPTVTLTSVTFCKGLYENSQQIVTMSRIIKLRGTDSSVSACVVEIELSEIVKNFTLQQTVLSHMTGIHRTIHTHM